GGAVRANLLLIALSKKMFSYQIYVEAETTPDVNFLLKSTKEKSAERAWKLRGLSTQRSARAVHVAADKIRQRERTAAAGGLRRGQCGGTVITDRNRSGPRRAPGKCL